MDSPQNGHVNNQMKRLRAAHFQRRHPAGDRTLTPIASLSHLCGVPDLRSCQLIF